MSSDRDKLIFGRYSREECGLPPLENPALAKWRILFRALALAAAMLFVGWLAGGLTARWRGLRLDMLPRHIVNAGSAREKARLLTEGRVLATALRDDPHAVLDLSEACLMVAADAPRQMGYYGNVVNLLDGIGERLTGEPFQCFRAESLHSMALAELGLHQEALAALARADKALGKMPDSQLQRALRLTMVNQQAYILATAPSRQVRNPEKALHLAQIMISSRDMLANAEYPSASAAFVDTLASAWFATGDAEKAHETQTLALGLANSGDLAIYLKHYDEYAGAPAQKTPRLMAMTH